MACISLIMIWKKLIDTYNNISKMYLQYPWKFCFYYSNSNSFKEKKLDYLAADPV